MRTLCTCGRDEVELGCDLCRYCRADHDERQYHREQEAAFNAEQEAAYAEWLNAQAALLDSPDVISGARPGESISQSVPRP